MIIIIIMFEIIIIILESFSHQCKLMIFHWSLSDSKSPQVFRIFLSLLADLSNTIVWTVSARPIITRSSIQCANLLVTIPRVPITIDIVVTFMFHLFFKFLRKVEVLIPLIALFQFYSLISRERKVHTPASPLFFRVYYEVW